MASTDVVISGETYSLLSEPAELSALVIGEKLLAALDLKALVEHLGHVGSFIRIAYNGIGAAGPRFQDLQIEIQRLGYDITKLCDKSAATIASFESAARTVLVELKATYQYLLDGPEEMSIFTLSSLADLAGKMAAAALELQREFESQERKVITTLETTQRTRGKEAIRIEELKKEQAEMEHNKQVQAKLIEEHRKLEEEARKERLYYERKEDKELSKKSGGFLKFGLRLVTAAVTSICGPWLGEALEQAIDEDKEDSAKRADAWKRKSLQKLEIEKEQRKLRHEALQKMADFTFQIQHLDREGNVAEIAVKALHEASGALKYLSAIMQQAENFWRQLQQHWETLASPQVPKQIDHVMKVYSEPEVRKKVWESSGFKTRAVSYYAKWVALYSVCGEYLRQIQLTQKDLYQFIVENPTYDEPRKRLHDLAAEFTDVLKAAPAEIAQEDFEADKEIRMLKTAEYFAEPVIRDTGRKRKQLEGSEQDEPLKKRLLSDEPSSGIFTETKTLGIKNLADITRYLYTLDKTAVFNLGLVLGLDYNHLKSMIDSPTFLEDMLAGWLQKVDYVVQVGVPTWRKLVEALKDPRVHQIGVASEIEQANYGNEADN